MTTTPPNDREGLEKLIAKTIAPKAWAAFGRLGVDNLAQESRRTASTRHARAALSALDSAGWTVVPREATDELLRDMQRAGYLAAEPYAHQPATWDGAHSQVQKLWLMIATAMHAAMVAASPGGKG